MDVYDKYPGHLLSHIYISISVASTIAMTRTNITMKLQKILIFPLIVLLMLSSILVTSRKSCWLLQHQLATNTMYMVKFDFYRQFTQQSLEIMDF
jgi:hypothetical protein